jgi:hypothetical protein
MTEFFPSHAEMMARSFGIVVGAASCSEAVSNQRLDAAAEKVKSVLDAAADDRRDAEAALERFSAAVVSGRGAARRGEIAEWAAETALRQLEDDLEEVEPALT